MVSDHPPTTLSLNAMATRFELVIYGDDPVRQRAVGEEALDEVDRLAVKLSFYDRRSDVAQINAHAAEGPVKVESSLFNLLKLAKELTDATDKAFDITIAPLMQAWGLAGGSGRVPEESELAGAMRLIGMSHVYLDEESKTVLFDQPGVSVDLGAIGKGYAIERAADMLSENGIRSALIHGGTSSVCGIGRPPGADVWRVGIRNPMKQGSIYETVELMDSALGVSALHGKSFHYQGKEFSHVINPETGCPVTHTLLAAVTGPSPTFCDALSTALLVLGESWILKLRGRFPSYHFIVIPNT